ncbi:bruno-like 4, RNA binding protein (Drosophila) (predicted), isoform CRA_b [Rattus norvegicus]|uniref:Bruno-like 4, RNA binding protein (Drosophila) (Predicted), isoform CRA_b n=1 Tax=Rattus norvegicus TaxID=10116 RepID=A6J2L6_RAT|nr:bruno-like 4, RNA binding protein (Drosophila) (predicted), isoform CRA_b [Rattus norvegicus]
MPTTKKKNDVKQASKQTNKQKPSTLKRNNVSPVGEAEGLGTRRRCCCQPILGLFQPVGA